MKSTSEAHTMAVKSKRKAGRTISFEIKTRKPLPVGEQVFVAGSVSMLGDWAPDGFPLTRMNDNLWFGSAHMPGDGEIEFKVTRGSWNDEEVTEAALAAPNTVLRAGGDATVRKTVLGWKDGR